MFDEKFWHETRDRTGLIVGRKRPVLALNYFDN
jgi:hypothetical protein